MPEKKPDTKKAEALATQRGALDLYSLALIGTMGTQAAPRALVRMPSGRITTVTIGDTLRGRRIDAIEPERVLMSRQGTQTVMTMPKG